MVTLSIQTHGSRHISLYIMSPPPGLVGLLGQFLHLLTGRTGLYLELCGLYSWIVLCELSFSCRNFPHFQEPTVK